MSENQAPETHVVAAKDRSKPARVINPTIKWKRTENGYQSKDGRFIVTKSVGRSYTRGPFKNFWSLKDTKTEFFRNAFDGLVDAKDYAEGIILLAALDAADIERTPPSQPRPVARSTSPASTTDGRE